MFNKDCRLHKYNDVREIINEFYDVRLDVYRKRKEYLIDNIEKKLIKLSNRARYITEMLADRIDLRRKKSSEVNDMLTSMEFAKIDNDYKYLIKMPMDSVTDENVTSILKEHTDTVKELDVLKRTKLETMWKHELQTLLTHYNVYKQKREKIQLGDGKNIKKNAQLKKQKVLKVKR